MEDDTRIDVDRTVEVDPDEDIYQSWRRQVDRECVRLAGMPASDLPDVDLRCLFEADVTPREAAEEALSECGMLDDPDYAEFDPYD